MGGCCFGAAADLEDRENAALVPGAVPLPPTEHQARTFTDEEVRALIERRGFGTAGVPEWQLPYANFKESVACFNWALTGGNYDDSMVDPREVFQLFSLDLLARGQGVDELIAFVSRDGTNTRQWLNDNRVWLQQQITAYQNAEDKDEAAHNINGLLTQKMIEAQGLGVIDAPANAAERRYAICMEYEKELHLDACTAEFREAYAGYTLEQKNAVHIGTPGTVWRLPVNFTHWGIQITDPASGAVMTVETFPASSGCWSESRSFYDTWHDPPRSFVVTKYVQELSPRHKQMLRGFLATDWPPG